MTEIGANLIVLWGAVLTFGTAQAGEPPAEPPAWMDLSVTKVAAGDIAGRYQRLLVETTLPDSVSNDPVALAGYKASPDYRFTEAHARLSEYTPTYFITWMFRAAPDARWPTRAIRMFNPDPAHYRIHTEVLCEHADDCEALRREALAMRAPEPGVFGRAPAREEWEALVANEACTPAEPSMPAPHYPPGASAAGNTGTTVVVVLFNPCGEVRAASVSQSSHDRDLDRAALNAARNWIIPVPTDLRALHRGGTGAIPVVFHLDAAGPLAKP